MSKLGLALKAMCGAVAVMRKTGETRRPEPPFLKANAMNHARVPSVRFVEQRSREWLFAGLLATGLSALANNASAACISPAGEQGDVIFNTSASTMQFCDGATWWDMKAADTLAGLSCTSGQVPIWNATSSVWACGTASSGGGGTTDASALTAGTVAVPRGGTGLGTSPANGQLLIGNGTGYTLGTLTAGPGVSITNASGAVTIGLPTVAGVTAGAYSFLSVGTDGRITAANNLGITLGGDLSGSVTLSASSNTLTASLANTSVIAGSYGGLGLTPLITVDAKGRITSISDLAINISASQITSGTLGVSRGGTGATTAAAALTSLGAVAKSGDTMTGNLVLSLGDPQIAFIKTASGNSSSITSYTGSSLRWMIVPGEATPESGSNAGSNFVIYRFGDNGAYLGAPFSISRSNGAVNTYGTLTISGITDSGGSASISVNKTASGNSNALIGYTNASMRWQLNLGDTTSESGSSAGSNFSIFRFSDASAMVGVPFTILRSNGYVGLGSTTPLAQLDVTGSIYSRAVGTGTTSYDFSATNVHYTSSSCAGATWTLSNMLDGGSYSLVVQGGGVGACQFTHSGLVMRPSSTTTAGNTSTAVNNSTSGKHIVFTFIRAGGSVYVTSVGNF